MKREKRGRIDAAVAALIADGCFCVAFLCHTLTGSGGLGLADYLAMALIICVFLTACSVIYHDHWAGLEEPLPSVKTLRIRELREGASVEFDGKRYRVDNIDHSRGEILLERVGQAGNILVQIEGRG